MFCPNCGTKNADSEAKCAQCGFDLQAKAPQARFKGTMVMNPGAKPAASAQGSSTQGSSAQGASGQGPAIPGAATASAAGSPAVKGSLKGTMIGMAPPEMQRALEEAKAKVAAQAAAATAPKASPPGAAAPTTTKPSLKGTMIGVAPPDMQAAIAAAKAKVADAAAAPGTAGPATAAPAAAAPATAAPATAKPSIKGTMIGVAPPDMAAAMAAHKAELEKRAAAGAQAAAIGTAPAAAAPPAAGTTSSPLGRAPNSKLKGTMIGVAPPDVSQVIADAKATAEAKANAEAKALAEAKANAASAPTPREGTPAAGRPAPNPDLGATMVGTAAPVAESLRPSRTSDRPAGGEFKGTMVGATSPLVESGDADGPDSRAAGNSDHPAAFASTSLSAVAEVAHARENLQRALADAEASPKPPTGRDIPTGAQSPAALRSAAQVQVQGHPQGQKSSSLPLVLLGVALLVVAILIGIALLNRPKAPEAAEKPPAAAPH